MIRKYEVVFAKNDSHVVDSLGNECRYRVARGRGLVRGYYIVTWPDDVHEPLFDEYAHYRGPFESPKAVYGLVSELLRDADMKPLLVAESRS